MPHEPYTIVEKATEGVAVLQHPKYGTHLWARRKLRKTVRCAACDDWLAKGTEAFGPITNGYNRMERVCGICVGISLPLEKTS